MEYKTSGKGLQMNMPQSCRIFRIPDQQKYTNSYHISRFLLGSIGVVVGLCLAQLRWLDTVFQGQYLPTLSVNYVAVNKYLEKLTPQLY